MREKQGIRRAACVAPFFVRNSFIRRGYSKISDRERGMNLAANLHGRLVEYAHEVILFIEKPEVPFTNNLAERTLRIPLTFVRVRMIRLLQKASPDRSKREQRDLMTSTPIASLTAFPIATFR